MTTDNERTRSPLVSATSAREETPPDPAREPEDGIALCLSGGGYRAMLFHLGSLWRLNEAGVLPRLARISSVSGGSITAGVLGLRWRQLGFDASDVTADFEREVVGPLRRLARQGAPSSFINMEPCWTPDTEPQLTDEDNQDPDDWTLPVIIRLSGLPVDADDVSAQT